MSVNVTPGGKEDDTTRWRTVSFLSIGGDWSRGGCGVGAAGHPGGADQSGHDDRHQGGAEGAVEDGVQGVGQALPEECSQGLPQGGGELVNQLGPQDQAQETVG